MLCLVLGARSAGWRWVYFEVGSKYVVVSPVGLEALCSVSESNPHIRLSRAFPLTTFVLLRLFCYFYRQREFSNQVSPQPPSPGTAILARPQFLQIHKEGDIPTKQYRFWRLARYHISQDSHYHCYAESKCSRSLFPLRLTYTRQSVSQLYLGHA